MGVGKLTLLGFTCFFLVGAMAPVFAQGQPRRRAPTEDYSEEVPRPRAVRRRPRKRALRTQRLSPMQLKLRRAVRRYVGAIVKENFGFYPIDDKEFNDSWMAGLKIVDMKRIRRVFEDEYILRGIFVEMPMDPDEFEGESQGGAAKEAPKLQTFEIDFDVVRGESGRWRVTNFALYKIGTDKLFTYSEGHERIPLERNKTVSVFSFSGEDAPEESGSEEGGPPEQEGEDPFAADSEPEDD